MTESAEPRGVTVATVLRDLADSRGLDLELLAGAAGVDRRITNPHPQKTGLALSGFDTYLRDGRVLVLGESEVRFLETLAADERTAVLQRVFATRSRACSSPAGSCRRRKTSPKRTGPVFRCSRPGPARR